MDTAAGPGAGSPWRCTSWRKPPNACLPVTFCSMIEGTSASITRRLAPRRQCGLPPPALGDGRVEGLEAGRVVVGAEQGRHRLQRPRRARSPRRADDEAVAGRAARRSSVAGPPGCGWPARRGRGGRCAGSGRRRRGAAGASTDVAAHGQSGRHSARQCLTHTATVDDGTDYVAAMGDSDAGRTGDRRRPRTGARSSRASRATSAARCPTATTCASTCCWPPSSRRATRRSTTSCSSSSSTRPASCGSS